MKKNVDMNIVEFSSAIKYVLHDSYSTSKTLPPEDVSLGGTFDLKNISYLSRDGIGNITYARKFDTGDKYDTVVKPDVLFNISVAWGDGDYGFHGTNVARRLVLINSTSQDFNPLPDEPQVTIFDFWQFHGILLTIIWTLLNFLGYIFARFYKHLTWWIWMHRLGAGMTALISIGLMGYSISACKIILIF